LFEVSDAMIRYGGSFVQALGDLLRRADPENQRRLVAAFPDYLEKYRELAQLAAARQTATDAAGAAWVGTSERVGTKLGTNEDTR
jgi:2-oxo-4-hydroxy-4-carboxy--5-ureidoimidazoline (OHCU) decarboxylase